MSIHEPGPVCPYCSSAITSDLTLCPSCSTAYHFECAAKAGGCIIPECSTPAAINPTSDPTSPPFPTDRTASTGPMAAPSRQKALLAVIGVALLLLGVLLGALGAKTNVFEFATGRLETVSDVNTATEKARSEGYDEGKKAGSDEGFAAGRAAGYANGVNDGKNNGYTDGYSTGVASGYQTGLSEGRKAGCQQVFRALDTTQVFPYFSGTRYIESLPSYRLSQC